jgi:hypothetical protein
LISGLVLDKLRQEQLYRRPEKAIQHNGTIQRWDVISDAPMSTDFSISRFLVPTIAGGGWALFCDADIMVRTNIGKLFALADSSKAVMCVHHKYPQKEGLKMDGQLQTVYNRKNWSSVMLFNCDHPANRELTVELVNTLPGRDLHRFCWLDDDEIGELPPEWNYCPGLSPKIDSPSLVHFTNGLPDVPGYENQEFADEWKALEPYAVGALFNNGRSRSYG